MNHWRRWGLCVLAALACANAAVAEKKPAPDPKRPKSVFVCATTRKKVDVAGLSAELKDGEVGSTPILGGQGMAFFREIAGGMVTFNVTPQVVWLHVMVENKNDARPVLQAILDHCAAEREIDARWGGETTNRIEIPVASDKNLAQGGAIPIGPVKKYLKCVPQKRFISDYEIESDQKVELKIEKGKVFWVSKKGDQEVKEEAATFVPIPKEYRVTTKQGIDAAPGSPSVAK